MRLDKLVHGSSISLLKILQRRLEPVLRARLDITIVLVLDVFFPLLKVGRVLK